MYGWLIAIYLLNAVALILHEMDSVHWQEWNLFGLPGGEAGFLVIHVPLLGLMLFGLLELQHMTTVGLIISLLVGLSGVFAFSIHTVQRKRGVAAFTGYVSKAILWSTLVLSLPQCGFSLGLLLSG